MDLYTVVARLGWRRSRLGSWMNQAVALALTLAITPIPVGAAEGFGGMAAVSDNRYKLVVPASGPPELYDIPADLKEEKDLAAQHPEIVSKMMETLRNWQRSVEVSLSGADYK